MASGEGSHAEGQYSIASGEGSHAEGLRPVASGSYSHAEGNKTVANHLAQHVFGACNVLDSSAAQATAKGTYIEIVGNGKNEYQRSNARTLDWNGNEVLAGKLTVGTAPTNDMDVATKQYVDQHAGSSFDLSDRIAKGVDDQNNEVAGAIIEGYITGYYKNIASGVASHAEGSGTIASGANSHTEGYRTTASNLYSHAE